MTSDELLKLLADKGITGVIALVLLWAMLPLVRKFFADIIAGLKELRDEVRAHTARDMEHHTETRDAVGELREDFVRLDAKVDMALELTPVREQRSPKKPRARTNPLGTPYVGGRARTHDDDKDR